MSRKHKPESLPLFTKNQTIHQGQLSLNETKNPKRYKPRVTTLLGELRRTIERTEAK